MNKPKSDYLAILMSLSHEEFFKIADAIRNDKNPLRKAMNELERQRNKTKTQE
jgi:hypothetical protein